MKSHHIPVAICPNCHAKADGAFSVDPDHEIYPQPGDVAICVDCQAINIYSDDHSLRAPTEEELKNLPMVEISRAQKALKEFHETYPDFRKLH